MALVVMYIIWRKWIWRKTELGRTQWVKSNIVSILDISRPIRSTYFTRKESDIRGHRPMDLSHSRHLGRISRFSQRCFFWNTLTFSMRFMIVSQISPNVFFGLPVSSKTVTTQWNDRRKSGCGCGRRDKSKKSASVAATSSWLTTSVWLQMREISFWSYSTKHRHAIWCRSHSKTNLSFLIWIAM